MNADVLPELDLLPSGCLVTSGLDARDERRIVYANHYVSEVLRFPPENLVGHPLSSLLTRASGVFFDTYVLPMLLHEGRCDEILIELLTPAGEQIPVIANAVVGDVARGLIYWSFFNATQRNKFYDELLEARRLLEEKGASLYYQSITDELTGLLNRRELVRRAEIIAEQARRSHNSMSVLVLDIDHFKRINDTLGHAEGDRILTELGALFREQGRLSDVIARFGGEEFVFVLPDADENRALGVASRLHRLVGRIKVADEPVTVSIGIALSESFEQLDYLQMFEQADRAVYQAKAQGRDQTVIYRG